MKMKFFFSVAFLGLLAWESTAQNSTYTNYIARYRDVAIKEMRQHGIPASITMAQGLLESAAGESELAKKANNHFGIKCTSDWKGPSVKKDDDRKDECFRKYAHPEESFDDHSQFLKRDRYSSLYSLKPTDYKGWAHGLRSAGYATDPHYATKLIKLIDEYDLHELDLIALGKQAVKEKNSTLETVSPLGGDEIYEKYKIYSHPNRKLPCVVVFEGDNIADIARRYDISLDRLLRYNDLRYDTPLIPGQFIFLKSKPTKSYTEVYTVQQGDTMYKIAQKMGMELKYLYTRNNIAPGTEPEAGTELYLRYNNPQTNRPWYKK